MYIFPVLYNALWIFCIALCIFIALPTIVMAIIVTLFALKGDSESKGKRITIAFKSKKERELLL